MTKIEYFPFYIGLTADDGLDLRMACNETAIMWGNKASEHREAGREDEAATCERIRTKYHELWERIAAMMERAPLAAREATADAMFAAEAREDTAEQWFCNPM